MKKPGLGLKAQLEAEKQALANPSAESTTGSSHARSGRAGKKPLIGYFSLNVSKTLGRMRVDEETTLQALMGEAIDLLMQSRGKHPFGER